MTITEIFISVFSGLSFVIVMGFLASIATVGKP